jgi:hypothetical protein
MNFNFKFTIANIIGSTIPEFILSKVNFSKNRKKKLKPFKIYHTPDNIVKLNKKNFLNFIFDSKFISKNKIYKSLDIQEDISSIKSYVPFIRNKTGVLIYNYMALHYGVRDPILCKVNLIDDCYDYGSIFFTLMSNEVKNFDQIDNFYFSNLPEVGKIEVHFYHPGIPKNIIQNQLRFFGIYKNEKNLISSGVHSMPCLLNTIAPQKKFFTRNFGDRKLSYNFLNDHKIKNNLKKKDEPNCSLNKLYPEKKIFANGYYVSDDLRCSSIWHDADPSRQYSNFSDTNLNCYTSFIVPNYNTNVPVLHINSKDTGVNVPCNISIKLVSKESIKEQRFVIDKDDFILDLDELNFDSELETKVFINFLGVINLKSKFVPELMVHYYFKNKNNEILDQGHSLKSLGYDNNIFNFKKSFRCKKFAPFFHTNKQISYYSIANLGIAELSDSHELKIRIFTTTNREFLITKKIEKNDIAIISSDEILKDISSTNLDSEINGIFYIENERKNLNAQWYICSKDKNVIATDHFTGG